MPNLGQDRRFLEAGVQSLTDYLLSNELFYPLDGDLPRLTIGNLLLARIRVMTVDPEKDYSQMETIKEKWKVAWEQKAVREIHSRLELWRTFLEEYNSSPTSHASRYPIEIRHRAIIRLLSNDSAKSPELAQLQGLDLRLKSGFIPGGFVWEKQVEQGFGSNEFWFLFGMLKSR